MRASLAVAVAQPAAGAEAHADAILRSGGRLVVFPELSLTGYHYDAAPVALDDPQLGVIVAACRSASAIALVGAPVAGPHIAMLRVDGEGASVAYRKWLVAPSETAHFKAGDGPFAIDVDGWRVGLGICFDTCNAKHWEATAALRIDLYVAGVLDSPDELATQDERIARFRPDGVAVAFASFAGATGAGYDESAGCSRIVDRDGVVVAQAGPNVGQVVTATLIPYSVLQHHHWPGLLQRTAGCTANVRRRRSWRHRLAVDEIVIRRVSACDRYIPHAATRHGKPAILCGFVLLLSLEF